MYRASGRTPASSSSARSGAPAHSLVTMAAGRGREVGGQVADGHCMQTGASSNGRKSRPLDLPGGAPPACAAHPSGPRQSPACGPPAAPRAAGCRRSSAWPARRGVGSGPPARPFPAPGAAPPGLQKGAVVGPEAGPGRLGGCSRPRPGVPAAHEPRGAAAGASSCRARQRQAAGPPAGRLAARHTPAPVTASRWSAQSRRGTAPWLRT